MGSKLEEWERYLQCTCMREKHACVSGGPSYLQSTLLITQIAAKLERSLVEHKRQLSEQQMEVSDLREQVGSLECSQRIFVLLLFVFQQDVLKK